MAAFLAGLDGLPSMDVLVDENERLRLENEQLEKLIAAFRPETHGAGDCSVPHSARSGCQSRRSQASNTQSAADRLMKLMSEGGDLLREREELEKENRMMMQDIYAAPVASSVAASPTRGGRDSFSQAGTDLTQVRSDFRQTGMTGTDFGQTGMTGVSGIDIDELDDDNLDKLLPLLSEADSLRAEREALRKEREDLLGALTDDDGPLSAGAAAERRAQEEEDKALKEHLQVAVDSVHTENLGLVDEIQKLKAANARLRVTRQAELRELERARREQVEADAARAAAESAAKARAERIAKEMRDRAEAEVLARAQAEAKARLEAEARAKLEAEARAKVEAEARAKAEAIARQRVEMAQMRAEAQSRMTGTWRQPPMSTCGSFGGTFGIGARAAGLTSSSSAKRLPNINTNAARPPPTGGSGRRGSLLGAGASMMRTPGQASMPSLTSCADDDDAAVIRQREAMAKMLKAHSNASHGAKLKSTPRGHVKFTVPRPGPTYQLSDNQELAMRSQLHTLYRIGAA